MPEMQDIICDAQQGLGSQVEHCCTGADYVCFVYWIR